MISLAEAYNKVDFVRRYQKAISTADIMMTDIDSYAIMFKYKGCDISMTFQKDKFLWKWKVVMLKPGKTSFYRKFADYHISYLDEMVFASKLCDLFYDKFKDIKGGDWYEKSSTVKPNVSYGFIERDKCKRYIYLDKGNISRRSLRIVC